MSSILNLSSLVCVPIFLTLDHHMNHSPVLSFFEAKKKINSKNKHKIMSQQKTQNNATTTSIVAGSSLTTTNFMGISVNENGPSDPRIIKALNSSAKILDIFKFIEITEFELNKVMFDYFWQVMVGTRDPTWDRVF